MEQLRKEAVRYLGYGKNAVDAQTLELIENSFRVYNLLPAGSPSIASLIYPWKVKKISILEI